MTHSTIKNGTLSIMALIITARHTVMLSVSKKHTVLSVVMLSVIMLSGMILNAYMLCVIILNVIMLTVSIMTHSTKTQYEDINHYYMSYCYAECRR
jgi:hypothetical protein